MITCYRQSCGCAKSQDQLTKKKKYDLYDLKSDEESESHSNVEIEANDYLNNAQTIESHPVVKMFFPFTQYSIAFQCTS